MASSTPAGQASRDATFRNYSSQQAEGYAKGRRGYPPALVNFILGHHRDTGGETSVLLDVGCGPGNSTRSFSPHFEVAFGADPGESMIKTATELGGSTASGSPIQYRLCQAEDISEIKELEHGSVDVITAASSAHWFDMPRFWAAAAKMLKPGGTVAIWTWYPKYDPPAGAPLTRVRAVAKEFLQEVLAPYESPGNRLVNAGYVGLGMPWDGAATTTLFERESLIKREWSGDSEMRDAALPVSAIQDPAVFMPRVQAMLDTVSAVTRWREAHPDLAGTDKDCVKVFMAELRKAIDLEGGAEMETLMSSTTLVLLCIKRAT